jgi:hypothetical protein
MKLRARRCERSGEIAVGKKFAFAKGVGMTDVSPPTTDAWIK